MKDDPLCIYAKEVARIIRRSERTGDRWMVDMLCFYGKKPHQLITIREFCEYAGLEYEEVMDRYFRKEKRFV
ncbi:MAG: hypothetical protein WKF68_13655 [Daejeonella sp.]